MSRRLVHKVAGRIGGVQGWVLLQTTTASSQANVDLTTGVTDKYDLYKIVITDLLSATDGENLQFRVSQAGAFKSGATDYEYALHWHDQLDTALTFVSSAAQGEINIANALSNVTARTLSGIIYIATPANTANAKNIWWQTHHRNNANRSAVTIGAGALVLDNAAIDGFRLLMSSAQNTTSGTVALYGLTK